MGGGGRCALPAWPLWIHSSLCPPHSIPQHDLAIRTCCPTGCSEHTIEENILKKSDQKRQLDFLAIQVGGWVGGLGGRRGHVLMWHADWALKGAGAEAGRRRSGLPYALFAVYVKSQPKPYWTSVLPSLSLSVCGAVWRLHYRHPNQPGPAVAARRR